MLDYLRAQKALTCSMVEELQSKTTTTGMHGAMLDMLSRRPAAAYFNYIQALTNAGRNDIADILRRANGQQEQVLQWEQQKLLQQELPQHVVHMPFQVGATHGFDDINRNFSRMELTKQSSARSIHGHYLTTVEIYSETLPYTSVPFQILPYVAATPGISHKCGKELGRGAWTSRSGALHKHLHTRNYHIYQLDAYSERSRL